MNAQEIISFIANAPKKTPVKLYFRASEEPDFGELRHFGNVIFGELSEVKSWLEANSGIIEDCVIELDRRNSAVPLIDLGSINARIEPGVYIRDRAEIGDRAVIMMGAVINIGAVIGIREHADGVLGSALHVEVRTVATLVAGAEDDGQVSFLHLLANQVCHVAGAVVPSVVRVHTEAHHERFLLLGGHSCQVLQTLSR